MPRLFIFLALTLICAGIAAAQQHEDASIPCGVHSGILAGHPCLDAGNPVTVSGPSPFAADCNGYASASHYHNAPVEPWAAVDPKNPRHFIGVWQQDRWADGAASALVAGTSFDGGKTWSASWARFSTCSGGSFGRASDPWVTFAPDGTAHQISLSVSQDLVVSAVLVSKSNDGGVTWGDPITLIQDGASGFNDKEMIVADPLDSNFVYAVWDRSAGSTNAGTYHVPMWFSRTTDGGATWESPRPVYDPGPGGAATAHQMIVLPDGTLVDVFVLSVNVGSRTGSSSVAVVRSTDRGLTWSEPVAVAVQRLNGVIDIKTRQALRVGAGIPSIAVDRHSGALYLTWEDSTPNNFQRDGIVLSRSTDGGLTWSAPVQVNQAPLIQAFNPAIAVGNDGSVAIDYFDFRKDTSDIHSLLTSTWRILSHDGGSTWEEFPLLPVFDMLNAPVAGGYFVGDYHALVPTPDGFLSFLVVANPAGSPTQTSVVAIGQVKPGDTRPTARMQNYLHRYVLAPKTHPPRRKSARLDRKTER